MKWLFCFKYAKTDSFGDNRKARRTETKQVSICIRSPRLKLTLRPCYRVLEMYKMYENPEKNHEKSPLSVDL